MSAVVECVAAFLVGVEGREAVWRECEATAQPEVVV
jgi:hypothetical protein